MKQVGCLLLLVIQTQACLGQVGFLKMEKVPANEQVRKLIKEKITSTLQVDFTGDNRADFICKTQSNPGSESYYEYWISSTYQVIKKVVRYQMDYDFFWLMNLDQDPEPEILTATGYEDGIDYSLQDQNLKTGQDRILFYFNPILVENNMNYWGYPWDFTNIRLKIADNEVYLQCSFDQIVRDDNFRQLNTQKRMPALFFRGHTTQLNITKKEVNQVQWLSLQEIVRKSTE
jgi:hypothetical protein